MKKIVSALWLLAIITIPAISSANSINGYIPLVMLNPAPSSIQSVYHVTNINSVSQRSVTITFYDNTGQRLSGAPISLVVAGQNVLNNPTGTTTPNPNNTAGANVYTNSDGTVNVLLPSLQQMYVVLLGTSNPTGLTYYVYNGWGVITSSPDGNSLVANGFVRNGPDSAPPYQRAVEINGGNPF